MTIGQRIKERRQQCGLTVDQLAAKLGKNRATVYRYESGDIENLPITVLEPIAKALRTTPQYLMGWTNISSESENSYKSDKNNPAENKGNIDYSKDLKSPDNQSTKEAELQGVYLSLAKEAQESGINPEDIKLAIETIKRIRASKGE